MLKENELFNNKIKTKMNLQWSIFRYESRFSIDSVDDKILLSNAIADHLCLAITENRNCSRITTNKFDNLLFFLKEKEKEITPKQVIC